MSTGQNSVGVYDCPIPLYPKIYPTEGSIAFNVHTDATCWSPCPIAKNGVLGYRGIGSRGYKLKLQSSYALHDTDTRALRITYHPPIPHIPLYPNIYRIRYNKGNSWGIGGVYNQLFRGIGRSTTN